MAGAEARDHVHVQLRHQIAERRDIELVAFGDLLQRVAQPEAREACLVIEDAI